MPASAAIGARLMGIFMRAEEFGVRDAFYELATVNARVDLLSTIMSIDNGAAPAY